VIIEDKIRDQEAGRKFTARLRRATNDRAQFPASRIPIAPHESSLASQSSRTSRLSRPIFSGGKRRYERETWQIKSPNSVIKTPPNFMKTKDSATAKSPKNPRTGFRNPHHHERWDSRFFSNFSPNVTSDLLLMSPDICNWSSPFLVDSAPPAESGLTYSKQKTEKILPDTRTHIKESRFCAKMSKETNEKTTEMKAPR
jgi:hypothetical protein